MANLLVIRGAPGSGKSTIAHHLVVSGLYDHHYEADMYFTDELGNYNWKREEVHKAHAWCKEKVDNAMERGYNVIVANTFTKDSETSPYFALAEKYGYNYQEMILWETPYENVHGVPQDTVERMQARLHNNFG